MELKEVESAIEGILFAIGGPVEVECLCLAPNIDRITADSVYRHLANAYRYERRGIRLVRLDNSYQLYSAPEFAGCTRRAFESRRPARPSQPALEMLVIIAYYQPAMRAYVDQIRGVDSSYTVGLLLERDLIEECSRLVVPGRPIQYRITQTLPRSSGLSNPDELLELPNVIPEDGQLILEMQAAVERLQAAQTMEGTGEVTEKELPQAAREIAQTEEEAQGWMKATLILGAVLLVLGALLRLVRLGALAEYSAAGLWLKLKVGSLCLMFHSRKPKRPRRRVGKLSRRERKREECPQPELGGGPLALVKWFLSLIAEVVGCFRRKLCIDVFQLEVTAAVPDLAAVVLCFGGASTLIGMIWSLVEQNFNAKERRLRIRVDFDAERPSVYLYVAATLTAGQALVLGLCLTTRFLAEFSKYRAEAGSPATSKQKEVV